jgi:hypothetical protein
METLTHQVDPNPARVAPGSGRARLTVATVVLAAALVFQPATSHAFGFGSLIGMLDQGGHHYRGKPKRVHHAARKGHHRGPEKSARKGPSPERSARKGPNGPIFTAAR